jgi:hypothetical protein
MSSVNYQQFNPRLLCTHEAAHDGYSEQMVRPNIVWDGGRSKPKYWQKYKRWNHEVNRELAYRWDKRQMHCIMRGPTGIEVWCYASVKAPRMDSAWEHQAARCELENEI